MKTTTDLLRTPSQNIWRQVLIRILCVLFACFFGVLNPGLVFAQQEMPKEWIRSELKKDDIKPPHIIFHAIVRSTALLEEKAIPLFQIQSNLGVTKQRAEEIYDYFVSINEKIEAENRQTELDFLCPRESRPTGDRIGVTQNTVDDLYDVIEEKHFALVKLKLSVKELQALDAWIEKRQTNISRFILDHTKTGTNEEKEYRLDGLCTDLRIREEKRS